MIAQKAYPERVAQIHIVNPPTILSAVMAIFKPLLKAKIRKRVSMKYLEILLDYLKTFNELLDYRTPELRNPVRARTVEIYAKRLWRRFTVVHRTSW